MFHSGQLNKEKTRLVLRLDVSLMCCEHGKEEADSRTLQESEHPTCPSDINGAKMELVSSTKFLGVHFPEELSWTKKTTSLAKKPHQRLYYLQILRRGVRGNSINSVSANELVVSWWKSKPVTDRPLRRKDLGSVELMLR